MVPWFALLALALAACTITDDQGREPPSPRLIEYAFSYDVTSFANFAPKPDTWSGDTLTHYDYWRLTDQPNFKAVASIEADVFHVRYEPEPGIALDWMPTVQTRLKILLPVNQDTLKVQFHGVEKASTPIPEIDPPILRNAALDYLLILRRH